MQNPSLNPTIPQISPLYQVVTIQEAASLFFVCESTIRYHMIEGRLIYRKVGGNRRGQYLIEFHSLVRHFGFCPKLPN